MGAPIEAVRKYINSALINDIYIQMDKKRGKSIRVSRARSVDCSLQHHLSLSLSLSLSRTRPLYIGYPAPKRILSSCNIFCT